MSDVRKLLIAALAGSIPFVVIGVGKTFGPEWSLACFLALPVGFVTYLWLSENTR